MKNRGYAMSAIVYPLLVVCLVLVVSLLFNFQNKQSLLEQLKNDVQDTYNVNSGIIWKTWLLKANSSYVYDTLEEALSDTDRATIIFNNTTATSYLKENSVLVSFIKQISNYKTELVEIILNSTALTNEEKYELGLPCYISNADIVYTGVGNGYSLTNKVEPLLSTNTACYADFVDINSVGFKLSSHCKGTIPYVYSNNYVDLTDYESANFYIEYFRNCTDSIFTVTSNFGFSKTKGLANSDFDKSYTFTFDNANSSGLDIGGENSEYLDYDLDISDLNGNYYYKHYMVHNGEKTDVCSGYNIIRKVYLY